MNRLLSILLLFCVYSHLYAQPLYDSFSPATSRPILDVVQNLDAYQPRTLYDIMSGGMNLYWDANGNIAEMIHCEQDAGRFHEWDEDNRLRFVLGESFAGYYGYDANGERVYKLTGTCGIDQINHNGTRAYVMFDDAVLYPNPYLVVTPRGYTKHYYAGTERLATAIGSGGFDDMGRTIGHYASREEDIAQMFYANYQNEDPFYYDHILSEMIGTSTIEGDNMPELEYRREPIILGRVDVIGGEDLLYSSIEDNLPVRDRERELFFSHSDHLGSANWITDYDGIPIQYLHYAPYGELIDNQQASGSWYDERYKFTGKERDRETGYDMFGARYLWSDAGIFISPDPLSDKDPGISPYAYCHWNPVKYIDPDGRISILWDIANVGIGAASLVSNLSNGNVADALLDGAGLMLDITAAVLPIVPGGASSAIKAYRTANKVSDVEKGVNKFREAVSRGIQSEKRVLKDMGLTKNTKKIAGEITDGSPINVIPDAIEDGVMYEIKDAKAIYKTKQIQGEYNAAKNAGCEFKIITGEKTHISSKMPSDLKIIKRCDLGPQ